MALSAVSSALLICLVSLFSYVYGVLWWKFEISENVRLSNATFASYFNCDSGVKCSARCHTERFCGFAQYSTQENKCGLFSTQVCGSEEAASQLNVYKRIPVDITDYLVQSGAFLIPHDSVTQDNAEHSIDGVIATFSYTHAGDSWWAMEFDSVWPIAKVTVTYFRPHDQMLFVDMSGTQFTNGPCPWIQGMYGVTACVYLPPTGCWHNASTINITTPSTTLGLKIHEISIES